jgi:hypothetical protein
MKAKTKALIERFDHLTYRGNSKHTRYGWLRLTPAFSVHLVLEIVRNLPKTALVLDPFCGTGTTALVCAQEGIQASSTDINPFLLWLAHAKCRKYTADELETAKEAAETVSRVILNRNGVEPWIPALFQIEKWWDTDTTTLLGKARAAIEDKQTIWGQPVTDLMKVAFCRMIIELANVSFGHQSMSFKKADNQMEFALPADKHNTVSSKWKDVCESILKAAHDPVKTIPQFIKCDARNLTDSIQPDSVDCVITSPPYPNRMSYIRELRPYMYWIGYLNDARQAGELDWEAIGGTWGCATSNLNSWQVPNGVKVPYSGFGRILHGIAETSGLLSQYVNKYFCDMVGHAQNLFTIVKPGGQLHYIVGNSKFYDVLVPVEGIFASLFESAGFTDVKIETIRKRTSKKELFEYVVSASKPEF